MNTASVIADVVSKNAADLDPIIKQCGGPLAFMSLLPHLQAVVETANNAADPATAVNDVVKHNEQSVRTIFQYAGGLDGIIRLTPNFVNIYRTVAAAQHPVGPVLQHAAKMDPAQLGGNK